MIAVMTLSAINISS